MTLGRAISDPSSSDRSIPTPAPRAGSARRALSKRLWPIGARGSIPSAAADWACGANADSDDDTAGWAGERTAGPR